MSKIFIVIIWRGGWNSWMYKVSMLYAQTYKLGTWYIVQRTQKCTTQHMIRYSTVCDTSLLIVKRVYLVFFVAEISSVNWNSLNFWKKMFLNVNICTELYKNDSFSYYPILSQMSQHTVLQTYFKKIDFDIFYGNKHNYPSKRLNLTFFMETSIIIFVHLKLKRYKKPTFCFIFHAHSSHAF